MARKDSPEEFAKGVEEWTLETVEVPGRLVAKVAIDMATSCARLTPWDTGLARANWLIAPGEIPDGPIDKKSRLPRQGAFFRAMMDYDPMSEDPIFIVNHVHYVKYLEHGTERFAGFHMVGKTIDRFEATLEHNMKRLEQENVGQ